MKHQAPFNLILRCLLLGAGLEIVGFYARLRPLKVSLHGPLCGGLWNETAVSSDLLSQTVSIIFRHPKRWLRRVLLRVFGGQIARTSWEEGV
jgi:hypothetical protein